MISRISESLENDSSPWRTMAQAEAWLAASARSHWWNTDIEVEAVMRIKRFQSERDHLRIGVLRIQSGRVRGFSERFPKRDFFNQAGVPALVICRPGCRAKRWETWRWSSLGLSLSSSHSCNCPNRPILGFRSLSRRLACVPTGAAHTTRCRAGSTFRRKFRRRCSSSARSNRGHRHNACAC